MFGEIERGIHPGQGTGHRTGIARGPNHGLSAWVELALDRRHGRRPCGPCGELAHHGDAMQAAEEGVWLHHEAARLAGPGFTAGDLADAVRTAMAQLS